MRSDEMIKLPSRNSVYITCKLKHKTFTLSNLNASKQELPFFYEKGKQKVNRNEQQYISSQ
jgi:hypothetical protein